jgi:TRAP-type uncharacterized transport system fused permease subunit
MGSPAMIALRVISSFIGLSCMAITFHGFLFRNLGWIRRLLFLIGGLLLVYPHTLSSLTGYVLVGLLVLQEWLVLRSRRAMASAGAE